MRFDFTDHAVARFIERHAPSMTISDARLLLAEAAPRAARLRTKTYGGQERWQLDEPRCILVCKREEGLIVCVTILPPQDAELVTDPTDE